MAKGGTGAGDAPAGEKAMALLLRPVRHAVNNLSMVMNANLESAMPQLVEGERVTRQIARAREAAVAYDALVRGFLSLGREEGTKGALAGRFIQELMPLLSLAAGSPLELQGAASTAVVQRRSPALEGALVLAAAGAKALPIAPLPPLRLIGAELSMDWPLPADAVRALKASGGAVRESETGAVIALPQG